VIGTLAVDGWAATYGAARRACLKFEIFKTSFQTTCHEFWIYACNCFTQDFFYKILRCQQSQVFACIKLLRELPGTRPVKLLERVLYSRIIR